MSEPYKIVIPARYASTRLPGKPLIPIGGKSLLQHTYEQACKSEAEEVIIATDDERILREAQDFCPQVIMTDSDCQSGTDRLAQVARQLQWDTRTIVVNVQGDEPLIAPAHIELTARALAQDSLAGIATLKYRIETLADLLDPNIVKVVCDQKNYALYFSRAPIPWDRDQFANLLIDTHAHGAVKLSKNRYFRHIGLYAYRVKTLLSYPDLPPADLEGCESLEQLRALYHGIAIKVVATDTAPGHGVDTQQDVARIRELLGSEDDI